jgi:hypothetical protein
MNNVGMGLISCFNWRNSSVPAMPGMHTSRIRREVRFRSGEARNRAADRKVATVNPLARSRLPVASPTEASSSTMEITAVGGLAIP